MTSETCLQLAATEPEYREMLCSILERAAYGVVLIGETGELVYANPAFTRITGYTLADVPTVDDWLRQIYPEPSYRQRCGDSWRRKDVGLNLGRDESQITCKDGTVKDIEFWRNSGDARQVVVTLIDVTEHRAAEVDYRRVSEVLHHRNIQLQTAVEVAKSVVRILDPQLLLFQTVNLIKESFDFYYVGIFLVDETGKYAVLQAGSGVAGEQMLRAGHRLAVAGDSMVGWAVANSMARIARDVRRDEMHFSNPYLPETRSELALPLISRGRCIGVLTVQSTEQDAFAEGDVATLQTMADQLAVAIQNARLFDEAQQEIARRMKIEERLVRRNRDMRLLNEVSRALISTLDLVPLLETILAGVQRLMGGTSASIWLLDRTTQEMVCQQASGPQASAVEGWRLGQEQGFVGWVAGHGESLLISDAFGDSRHFTKVTESTGILPRSVLSVPLKIKQEVTGVLQVVSLETDRFESSDATLLESLAAVIAIVVENVQLYEQARQDAETKTLLLQEVNHRVKNNLMAIIGLLYTERQRVKGMEDHATFETVLEDLTGRLKGLATVHDLLSETEWSPLLLSDLASQIINSALRTLPPDKSVSVRVLPSPVRVTANQAHNLTLVINELVMNTLRHALPERESIAIRVSVTEEGNRVSLMFCDEGPGFPVEVLQLEHYNVGFGLVRNLVARNLHGRISLYNEHGAVVVIEFPNEVGN